MGRTHPRLDGAERMLDRASSGTHEVGVLFDSGINSVDQMLVLPTHSNVKGRFARCTDMLPSKCCGLTNGRNAEATVQYLTR